MKIVGNFIVSEEAYKEIAEEMNLKMNIAEGAAIDGELSIEEAKNVILKTAMDEAINKVLTEKLTKLSKLYGNLPDQQQGFHLPNMKGHHPLKEEAETGEFEQTWV